MFPREWIPRRDRRPQRRIRAHPLRLVCPPFFSQCLVNLRSVCSGGRAFLRIEGIPPPPKGLGEEGQQPVLFFSRPPEFLPPESTSACNGRSKGLEGCTSTAFFHRSRPSHLEGCQASRTNQQLVLPPEAGTLCPRRVAKKRSDGGMRPLLNDAAQSFPRVRTPIQ